MAQYKKPELICPAGSLPALKAIPNLELRILEFSKLKDDGIIHAKFIVVDGREARREGQLAREVAALDRAQAIDRGKRNTLQAAYAKCFAADTAMRVATDAVQLFGAAGISADVPINRYFRDAKVVQINRVPRHAKRVGLPERPQGRPAPARLRERRRMRSTVPPGSSPRALAEGSCARG